MITQKRSAMKRIKDITRAAQLMLAELLAYRLNSLREALHYHHTLKSTAHYEGSQAHS